MNTALQHELLTLLHEDYVDRNRITADGALLRPSNPNLTSVVDQIREVNRRNAARLQSIVAEHGWPGISLVGTAGARAAYRLVLHAITLPDFQRAMLALIARAAAAGEASSWEAARLDDIIRRLEGQPQKYGTQFNWNENDELFCVGDLRAEIGLCSLEDEIELRDDPLKKHRRDVSAEEAEQRRREAESLARLLGWR